MIRTVLSLLCVFALALPVVNAQSVTGRIVDKKQEPVPYVTVYISELQQGIVTNAEGIFELAAPQGSYQLVIGCLGYKTARISWQTTPAAGGEVKIIVLEEAEYEIPPVYVTARKEDPAFTIMRKAIGMAPYYRNLVQSYRAEVYLKGNLNVKLKGVVTLALSKEQRNALKNASGIYESVNEIRFTAPDKVEQRVKSEKTAANFDLEKLGIKESDIQLGLANLNVYSNQPNMPLAPNAFQNYTFKYLGDSQIDGEWVAKIGVTPKRKSNDLLTGYLFIVREKWCVQQLDLTMEISYGKATAQQTYRFVTGDVLLPVAYNLEGEFNAFGVSATGHTSGSIKYFDVQQNQRLAQSAVREAGSSATTTNSNNKNASNTVQQVQELLDKSELRPRDMRQLQRIQEQAVTIARAEERKERREKPSLEVISSYNIIRDSVHVQRDSLYWALIRPVPLDRGEVKIFEQSDSIKALPYTPEGKRKRGMAIAMGVMGSGYTFEIDSLWSVSYSGLINPLEGGYNVVDGWVYEQAFRVRKETKNHGYIQLRGRASYAFCREAWMWNVLAEQRYWANKRAYWRIEASSQSRDFAGNQGMGMVNDWSSLLFRINPSRFYNGRGVKFNHRIDIVHGLVWDLGVLWEERRPLSNTNDYSWFYKNSRAFSPNIPNENVFVSKNSALIAQNRAATVRLGLSYTPMQRYRMYEGRKIMLSSDYPTTTVEWIKGIPNVWGSQTDFDFVGAQVSQSRDFGYHKSIDYRFDAGKFFNTKQLFFADFHHTYSNHTGVSLNRGLNTLQLFPTYLLSTPEWYIQAVTRYQMLYLALKYLPIFKNPFVREGVQISYLLQPNLRHYTEFGYSLNNLFMIFDVGVFVGFEQARYRSWGFRLSVPVERLFHAIQL